MCMLDISDRNPPDEIDHTSSDEIKFATKIEEVDAAKRSIRLSGVDLVDGTPVLDVKPYVPDYDRPRTGDTRGLGRTGAENSVRVAVSCSSLAGSGAEPGGTAIGRE